MGTLKWGRLSLKANLCNLCTIVCNYTHSWPFVTKNISLQSDDNYRQSWTFVDMCLKRPQFAMPSLRRSRFWSKHIFPPKLATKPDHQKPWKKIFAHLAEIYSRATPSTDQGGSFLCPFAYTGENRFRSSGPKLEVNGSRHGFWPHRKK